VKHRIKKIDWSFNRNRKTVNIVVKVNEIIDVLNELIDDEKN